MAYDSLSPEGEKSLGYADRAVEIWHQYYPSWQVHQTRKPEPTRAPAIVDGIITETGLVRAVVEIKARDLTLDKLQTAYYNNVLVTFDKITRSQQIAQALDVSLLLFTYLIPDDLLVWKAIWKPDDRGCWQTEISMKNWKTQETVNGGEINRFNAFVSMKDANIWKSKNG